MKDIYILDSYDYELPEEKIAQEPTVPAHDAKLLFCNVSGSECEMSDGKFIDLEKTLTASDVLFLNDSFVVKARIPLKDVKCVRTYENPSVKEKQRERVLDEGEIFVYKIISEYIFECLVSSDKHFHP